MTLTQELKRRLQDIDEFHRAEAFAEEVYKLGRCRVTEIQMTQLFFDALHAAVARTTLLVNMRPDDPWRNLPKGVAASFAGMPIKIVPGAGLWFDFVEKI